MRNQTNACTILNHNNHTIITLQHFVIASSELELENSCLIKSVDHVDQRMGLGSDFKYYPIYLPSLPLPTSQFQVQQYNLTVQVVQSHQSHPRAVPQIYLYDIHPPTVDHATSTSSETRLDSKRLFGQHPASLMPRASGFIYITLDFGLIGAPIGRHLELHNST